jgi:alpha-galactosidase
MELFHAQCGVFFSSPENFPVSYRYGGAFYTGFPRNTAVKKRFLDGNMTEILLEGTLDSGLTLMAECTEYRDYPALEWTVYASSANPGAILEDFKGADMVFNGPDPVLVSNNGDFCSAEGYTPARTVLKEGVTFTQAPVGGRPCDRAFPYQRLLFKGWGVSIAIGWPGQWNCAWKGLKHGASFTAGQETVHTTLKAGEVFRSPRMALVYFTGNEERGVNVWRRWYRAHVLPRRMGEPVKPAMAFYYHGGPVEFTRSTEENQLKNIKYVKDHIKGAGVWWIDAGWYPAKNAKGEDDWASTTGTWSPDPKRYPNGFGPVGRAVKDAGMDFLVWFEPERVRPGTWLAKEHPEWMLKTKSPQDNMLLDLTNPGCHAWLCNHILGLIRESGIQCYRQDFNFKPLQFWRDNEAPDRQGMVENLYVQGYLKYWDFLLTEEPNLWIDSCSAGGRRNDLETMRRSVPLHPTDYGYGYHHINQAFRHTLYSWLVYVRSFTISWDENNEYFDPAKVSEKPSADNFKLVNGFAVMTIGFDVQDLEAVEKDIPYFNKMLAIFRPFSKLALNGDFYALTENHRDNKKWTVFQFNEPGTGRGALQVLRNNQSPDGSLRVFPRGLDREAAYVMTNEETGERYEISGQAACEQGLQFTQPVRSGAVWFYEKL